MCTLDDMKGVRIDNTYRTDKQCATFIHHIAQAQKDEIKERVTEAKFVSSSAMVQLTTATQRPNWHMFGTVTKDK